MAIVRGLQSDSLRRRFVALGPAVGLAFLGSSFSVLPGPALADQTDPLLEAEFAALQAGPAADAPGHIERIRRLWADTPSDSVDLLFARALASAEAGEPALAEELLDHALLLSPNFAEAFVLRGVARRELGEAVAAIEDLTVATRLEPRHFLAHRMLAELRLAAGDVRGAYDHFKAALEANPHDAAAAAQVRRLARDVEGQET